MQTIKLLNKFLFFLMVMVSFFVLSSCKKNTNNASSNGTVDFVASSSAFINNGTYPKKYTCDSLGISPPIAWANVPVGTTNFAITMHTIAVDGARHEYIILYNIPTTTFSIPEASTTIGLWGINTVNKKNTYTPPCSSGIGAKSYVITVYALSSNPVFSVPQNQVTMTVLLNAISGKTLASSVLNFTYTR